MSNLHADIPDAEIHVAKGHRGALVGSDMWKDEKGGQSWQKAKMLPACLGIADSNDAPPTTADGDIYLIDNSRGYLDIDTIKWQSGNTIRYAFNGAPDLSAYNPSDSFRVSLAGAPINNGNFLVTDVNVGAYWIEVSNPLRSDAADDEASDSMAIAVSAHYRWSGANQGDWARVDGTGTWYYLTPEEGTLCYNKFTTMYYCYNKTVFWLNVVNNIIPKGNATLTGGTVAVIDPYIKSSNIVLVTVQQLGTVAAPKAMLVTITDGVGFDITSSDGTDTSVVAWAIM